MMTDAQMLAAYEDLTHLSRRMLASTEQGQWEQMAAQQDELAALLDLLKREDAAQERAPAALALKKGLIEDVLAMQQATLALALPWRSSIAAMLDSAGSAKRVAHAYGQGGS